MTCERNETRFHLLNDTLMCLSDHARKIMLITMLLVASMPPCKNEERDGVEKKA
jgi:hypothetical protein